MKKHWIAVLIPLGLGLLGYSCDNKKVNTTPTPEELIEAVRRAQTDNTPVQAPVVEDNGDPSIVAASVDTMEMVVDNRGNLVGRYVQTNQNTFVISVQDDTEVPRLGHKIVVYRARDGKGILYTTRKNVNIRKEPNLESTVICQITNNEDGVPDTYPCLGKTKGWYKINVNGKIGYVRHDLVIWDGMDTF